MTSLQPSSSRRVLTFATWAPSKGNSNIGDKINTQIIQPLIEHNARLARSDFPDFNDPNKLGEGKDMVDRLTSLIAILEKPELDFSQNRADHDDILGDAYEYLKRHFAQDSGKCKGQFYTPSEVSRVIAKVIGIGPHNTVAKTSAYDPTCGSGSLLLKVAAEQVVRNESQWQTSWGSFSKDYINPRVLVIDLRQLGPGNPQLKVERFFIGRDHDRDHLLIYDSGETTGMIRAAESSSRQPRRSWSQPGRTTEMGG